MNPIDPTAAASAAATAATAVTSSGGHGTLLLPALLLAGLAVAAAILSRRRARLPRLVQVLETVSLGPRRSLVVAQLQGEALLIGVSEGSVSLLLTRPVVPAALQPAEAHGAPRPPPPAPELQETELADSATDPILARLRSASDHAFSEVLAVTAEDLDLRRKLAARSAGSAR